MAVESNIIPNAMPLDIAYKHVRDWYLANIELAPKLAPTSFLADRARTLITNLPESLTELEMRAVLHEVLEGLLDWGTAESDGKFQMADYARAGLAASGGERFTMEERSKLQSSSSLSRVLVQDYHKDPEEERDDGYRKFDASADETGPKSSRHDLSDQGLQRDVSGVGARRFPTGAPERGFAVRNKLDSVDSSLAEDAADADPTAPKHQSQQDVQGQADADKDNPAPTSETASGSPLPPIHFTERCKRILVAAAGYTRNRRQRQPNSLTTTAVLYALIDFALLDKIEDDDAAHIMGSAVRAVGVDAYQERRKRLLKQEIPVTVFDHEPLSNALANVSDNTRTLLVEAQRIARQTTAARSPVESATLPTDTRHLIAAMLTAFPQGRQRSGQLQLISLVGLKVISLKNALYLFVSQHFAATDFLDKWSETLQVLPTGVQSDAKESDQENFDPWIAGYVSDSTKNATDDLGISRDVQTLISVILAKDVSPPLSIGLFGDWGTGKTFFMDRMREEIDLVKKQAANPSYSKFHTRVAQITFNAWHYVDANLWASLVSHILEKLVEEIAPKPDEVEVRKKLC